MRTVPVNDRLLLRVSEAAALCSMSPAFMYKMIQNGNIPVVRIGRTTRIPRAWLENWIATQVAKWQENRERC